MAQQDKRTRNWCAVFFDDDEAGKSRFSPKYFISKMNEYGVTAFCSPRHDKDVYTADAKNEDGTLRIKAGELKKPHYHVVMLFPSVKSYSQVVALCQEFDPTVKHAKACISTGGAIAYLIHAKNPDKHQYDAKAVLCTEDTTFEKALLKYAENDTYSLSDLVKIIREHEFQDFADFVDYAFEESDFEMLECCNKYCYMLTQYIKQRKQKALRVQPKKSANLEQLLTFFDEKDFKVQTDDVTLQTDL